jgi:hypothetical protein
MCPIWANPSLFPGDAKPSVLFRTRQCRLVIGIPDGFKAEPGDVIFIGKTIALLVHCAEIPPIEPGTMETGRYAAAMAALPVPGRLTGEILWPGYAAWPDVWS